MQVQKSKSYIHVYEIVADNGRHWESMKTRLRRWTALERRPLSGAAGDPKWADLETRRLIWSLCEEIVRLQPKR